MFLTDFLIRIQKHGILFLLYLFFFFQEAMMKDTLERAREPNLDLKAYLSNAYVHPVFKDGEDEDSVATDEEKEVENVLVPTKRASRRNTPVPSKFGCSSPPSLPDDVQELL